MIAEARQILLESSTARECEASVGLFAQGDDPHEIIIVDRGLIKLSRLEEDSQELVFGLRGPGAILGTAAAILQRPHSMSAITSSRCDLRRVPLRIFLSLVETNRRLSWCLQQMHCQEIYDQVSQLAELRSLSARQRLEQLLFQLLSAIGIDDSASPIRLQLPFKYREIAQLISVTPEHLSRLLRQMQNDGMMIREQDTIAILAPDRLYRAPAAYPESPLRLKISTKGIKKI